MSPHAHCLWEIRLACLDIAGRNAAHPEDADEVLMLADMYFDYVCEVECEHTDA